MLWSCCGSHLTAAAEQGRWNGRALGNYAAGAGLGQRECINERVDNHMGTFRKAKITTTLVEKLESEETVMDSALDGFGVRRQGDGRVYFVGRLEFHVVKWPRPSTLGAASSRSPSRFQLKNARPDRPSARPVSTLNHCAQTQPGMRSSRAETQ